jgi:hypothetical protein
MGVWKFCEEKEYVVVGAWLLTGKICCFICWNGEDKLSCVLLAQGRGMLHLLLTYM